MTVSVIEHEHVWRRWPLTRGVAQTIGRGESGVGGGLIAVSPGKLGIAVVSPPPDDAGISVRAQGNRRQFKNALRGNPLAPTAR
jgi:hypothetical protein